MTPEVEATAKAKEFMLPLPLTVELGCQKPSPAGIFTGKPARAAGDSDGWPTWARQIIMDIAK